MLRANPQDVPHSRPLFLLTLLANFSVGMMHLLLTQSMDAAVGQSMLMVLVTVVFTAVVLQLKGHPERSMQTMSAILGTGVMLSLLIYPVLLLQLWLLKIHEPVFTHYVLASMSLMLMITVNIWMLVVLAHIYRHALEVNLFLGLLVTFALLGLNVVAFTLLTSPAQ